MKELAQKVEKYLKQDYHNKLTADGFELINNNKDYNYNLVELARLPCVETEWVQYKGKYYIGEIIEVDSNILVIITENNKRFISKVDYYLRRKNEIY